MTKNTTTQSKKQNVNGADGKAKTSAEKVSEVFEMLKKAAALGGPSALCIKTYLKPAGGFDRLVAPAKYSDRNDNACYVFEQRYIADENSEDKKPELRTTVLMDSRESNANRLEEAIANQIEEDSEGVFAKMPKIKVTYTNKKEEGTEEDANNGENKGKNSSIVPILDKGDSKSFYDYELPHRAFDAHIRFGKKSWAEPEKDNDAEEQKNNNATDAANTGDTPEDTAEEDYMKAKKSTPKDAGNLFDMSPITVLLGGWDSHGGKAKFQALVVGETYAVLPREYETPEDAKNAIRKRSGSRRDPLAASFKNIQFSKKEDGWLLEHYKGKKYKGKKILNVDGDNINVAEGSSIGVGYIPPQIDLVDGVAVEKIVRHNIVQFGAIRQLHFRHDNEKDKAIRVLLAAMAIDAVVNATNDNSSLRANAQLSVDKNFDWEFDTNDGNTVKVAALTSEDANELLKKAYEAAKGVKAIDPRWDGNKVLYVTGHSKLLNAAGMDEEKEEEEKNSSKKKKETTRKNSKG